MAEFGRKTREMREKLEKVHQLLSQGWCQRSSCRLDPQTGTVQYCLFGAVERAIDPGDRMKFVSGEWRALVERLRAAGGFRTEIAMISWNDHPRTTQKDVLNLIEKAMEGVDAR